MHNRITVQLPVDGLLFWKLSGREALSEPYALGLTLLGTDARMDRSQLLGKSVTVTIPGQDMTTPRYLNGKVTRVAVSAVELSGTRYGMPTNRLNPTCGRYGATVTCVFSGADGTANRQNPAF